jgi:hypothetical protein
VTSAPAGSDATHQCAGREGGMARLWPIRSRGSYRTATFASRDRQAGKLIEIGDTRTIFSNPTQKATEDYISGRFG